MAVQFLNRFPFPPVRDGATLQGLKPGQTSIYGVQPHGTSASSSGAQMGVGTSPETGSSWYLTHSCHGATSGGGSDASKTTQGRRPTRPTWTAVKSQVQKSNKSVLGGFFLALFVCNLLQNIYLWLTSERSEEIPFLIVLLANRSGREVTPISSFQWWIGGDLHI